MEVSNDNSNWNLIESWSTSDEGAIIRSWDISAYAANQPTVYIRWTYIDNNNWSMLNEQVVTAYQREDWIDHVLTEKGGIRAAVVDMDTLYAGRV